MQENETQQETSEEIPPVEEQAQQPPEPEPKRRNRAGLFLCLVGIAAIIAILFLKGQKEPVQPRPPAEPPVNYSDLIKLHSDQAGEQMRNALQLFEMNVKRVVRKNKPKMTKARIAAAEDAADYKSCTAIVNYLAWDKIKDENETETYINNVVRPHIAPVVKTSSEEVNAEIARFDYELRRITLELAVNLAALGAPTNTPPGEIKLDRMTVENTEGALRNLGFNAAGVGVSLVFDVTALAKSKIAPILWKRIASIAGKLFGKAVAKASASIAIALADGPLPVGDIFAVCGAIWTGYDIHKGQQEFEKEMNVSLENLMQETRDSILDQTFDHAESMVKHYQGCVSSIGVQSLQTLTGAK